MVNLAVAMVAGAPAFANAASLAFANLAHGRDKTRWVSSLMAACALCAILIALSPVSAAGLLWLVFWMIAARLCWAGVVTLRAAIWRANFPRHVRATITGRIAVTYSLLIAVTAASDLEIPVFARTAKSPAVLRFTGSGPAAVAVPVVNVQMKLAVRALSARSVTAVVSVAV
jgi:hypothetical protein